MAIFKSISSLTISSDSMKSSISNPNVIGSISKNNSVACFDGGLGGFDGFGGCGGCGSCGGSRNTNIIILDINIGRRHRTYC
ncbi:hypothetical protein RB653_010438 [Dictyostelium firmibasis]|uniref:Uncharacterized protein n=1 Tax=Dictyostelium firmibasis TaxID=79012 RepID=A0AAN7YTN0_9MYCE